MLMDQDAGSRKRLTQVWPADFAQRGNGDCMGPSFHLMELEQMNLHMEKTCLNSLLYLAD